MESVQDTLRNHEKRITRSEVKIAALEGLKIDHRLNRIDKVFFAASIGLAFTLWLIGNTPMVKSFLESMK